MGKKGSDMRKLFLAAALIVAVGMTVSAGERKTFFDLYSIEVPDGWETSSSLEEYSAVLQSPDEKALIYILPPDPESGATNQEYAEWFLNRYAKGIGAETWGVITEDSTTNYNGYPSFMLVVGMPEENAKVLALINVFNIDNYQVLQFAFTTKDKSDPYLKIMGEALDTFKVDEDAMRKIEFTLRKKGDYITNKFNDAYASE